MRAIYLDNAATTRAAPEVIDAVRTVLGDDFGNPSSAHRLGIAATAHLKTAREVVLAALGDERGRHGNVIWTSGGTEADALGILGTARAHAGRGRHLGVTAIEHPAVLASAKLLEAEGFTTTIVPVSREGVVAPAALVDAVTDQTVVVGVMLVNNELGTIQPIAEATRAIKAKHPAAHVHCDAVQALGKIAIDVELLGVDTLAVSAHKIHGPKGTGALWIRHGARIAPLWAGGGQQGGIRPGTENVAGIAGFAEATRLAMGRLAAETARLSILRATLEDKLLAANLGAWIHGADAPRVPHVVSVALPGIPAEPLLHALEARGIYVSAGAACASKSHAQSHVLHAIHTPAEAGTLRLSFGAETTTTDVEEAALALIEEARAMAGRNT